MIVDLFIRLIVVCFGFFLAIVGAAVFFVIASLGLDWFEPARGGDPVEIMLRIGLFVGAVASVAGMVAAAPVLFAIAVAEAFRLRSLVGWLVLGGMIGGIAVILWDENSGRAGGDEYLIGIASGIAGTVVYWLIAGRNAGRWLERARARAAMDK